MFISNTKEGDLVVGGRIRLWHERELTAIEIKHHFLRGFTILVNDRHIKDIFNLIYVHISSSSLETCSPE